MINKVLNKLNPPPAIWSRGWPDCLKIGEILYGNPASKRKITMRDLIFKNRISPDKRKKLISSSEVINNTRTITIIRRHFICLIKEINKEGSFNKTKPIIYVRKETNHKLQFERFFCKIKGNFITEIGGKSYLLIFSHSLKINLKAVLANAKNFV